ARLPPPAQSFVRDVIILSRALGSIKLSDDMRPLGIRQGHSHDASVRICFDTPLQLIFSSPASRSTSYVDGSDTSVWILPTGTPSSCYAQKPRQCATASSVLVLQRRPAVVQSGRRTNPCSLGSALYSALCAHQLARRPEKIAVIAPEPHNEDGHITRTISRPQSAMPAATSRRRPPPTRTARATMVPPFYRRG